jgi:hypothetical protein
MSDKSSHRKSEVLALNSRFLFLFLSGSGDSKPPPPCFSSPRGFRDAPRATTAVRTPSRGPQDPPPSIAPLRQRPHQVRFLNVDSRLLVNSSKRPTRQPSSAAQKRRWETPAGMRMWSLWAAVDLPPADDLVLGR